MTEERIIDLMDKGYITHTTTPSVLAQYPEAELIEKGYITQVGIFDGIDDTIEEVPVVDTPVEDDEPVVDPEVDTPVEDDEPVVDPDDAPVVDDGLEDEIVAEGDIDAGIVEG